jgi:hypothetical protein
MEDRHVTVQIGEKQTVVFWQIKSLYRSRHCFASTLGRRQEAREETVTLRIFKPCEGSSIELSRSFPFPRGRAKTLLSRQSLGHRHQQLRQRTFSCCCVALTPCPLLRPLRQWRICDAISKSWAQFPSSFRLFKICYEARTWWTLICRGTKRVVSDKLFMDRDLCIYYIIRFHFAPE